MRLLGFVGHHYGFGRDDLLDCSPSELKMWAACINAAQGGDK